MAATGHPTYRESVVIIGSALAYTLDNWDEFSNEFGKDYPEIVSKGMDELKEMFTHLFTDMETQLDNVDRIDKILDIMHTLISNR